MNFSFRSGDNCAVKLSSKVMDEATISISISKIIIKRIIYYDNVPPPVSVVAAVDVGVVTVEAGEGDCTCCCCGVKS